VLLLQSDQRIEYAAAIYGGEWTDIRDWPDARYVRAQLMTAHGEMLALSNPIFAT
jgi:hypothetical protein